MIGIATWLQVALAILGVVGVSGFIAIAKTGTQFTSEGLFFRFQPDDPADIVLTTSAYGEGGFGPVKYPRALTAIGNLRAATEIAQVIGFRSSRRKIRVSVSAELENTLNGDLVLIGLPGKNHVSALVLERLAARYPQLEMVVEESREACRLGLGGLHLEYRVEFQSEPDDPELQRTAGARANEQIPSRDLALIVFAVNPLSTQKRRLIWCAGFTGYGTAAAARYLTDQILPTRLSRLRAEQRHEAKVPRLLSRSWVCFAMLIEVTLVHDQVVTVTELAFVPLEDPGPPPFSSGRVEAEFRGGEASRGLESPKQV